MSSCAATRVTVRTRSRISAEKPSTTHRKKPEEIRRDCMVRKRSVGCVMCKLHSSSVLPQNKDKDFVIPLESGCFLQRLQKFVFQRVGLTKRLGRHFGHHRQCVVLLIVFAQNTVAICLYGQITAVLKEDRVALRILDCRGVSTGIRRRNPDPPGSRQRLGSIGALFQSPRFRQGPQTQG